jgi:hypothetical protein
MAIYEFGAGGFKLGERVEILMTGQRGVLISETIHVSGCNTYEILLPGVIRDGRMKITHRDHLILRRLELDESMLDKSKELTDENTFSPKGIDVNAEWIRAAVKEKKEFIPEVDDAIGIEEISIYPGMEVWNKKCGRFMTVSLISRDIYSKELEYCLMYMIDDREALTISHAYSLIPIEKKFSLPISEKLGSMFNEERDEIKTRKSSIYGARTIGRTSDYIGERLWR